MTKRAMFRKMSLTEKDMESMKKSLVYREFLAESEEISKLKWIESEKAGHDIGLPQTITQWVIHHRDIWLHHWLEQNSGKPTFL